MLPFILYVGVLGMLKQLFDQLISQWQKMPTTVLLNDLHCEDLLFLFISYCKLNAHSLLDVTKAKSALVYCDENCITFDIFLTEFLIEKRLDQ